MSASEMERSGIELGHCGVMEWRYLLKEWRISSLFYVFLSFPASGFITFSVNISKMANDLRMMSSGPKIGLGEINLPAKQNGSSIMPGKINSVIPEVVNQVAFNMIGNDMTITIAAEAGQLELNAFEPIIFYNLFQSIETLTSACGI